MPGKQVDLDLTHTAVQLVQQEGQHCCVGQGDGISGVPRPGWASVAILSFPIL